MAASLIVVAASAVQVVVWLIGTRLPSTITQPNSVVVHGLLLELPGLLSPSWLAVGCSGQKVQFTLHMLVAVCSGVFWYGVARMALGPAWGLWTGLCWVCHPSFAFLAPRPSKLVLLIVMVPLVWCALLSWDRSRRSLAAAAVGLSLAILAWVGIQGLLMAPLLLAAMLVAPAGQGRRWLGGGTALVVFVLLAGMSARFVVPPVLAARQSANEGGMPAKLAADLWNALDDKDGSTLAAAAHAARAGHGPQDWSVPLWFLWTQARLAPGESVIWLAHRVWRTLYSTAGGHLQRVLLGVQLLTLAPALWGYLVALRHRCWRWVAVSSGFGVAVIWLVAALTEPLARNLTPAGGFGVMFALVGLADGYERLCGRRLVPPQRQGRSA